MKKIVIEASILAHHKQNYRTNLEYDSSNYVNSGVFSQFNKDELLHSVFLFSNNPNSADRNYEIYNKELIAIIQCFE